MESLGDIIRQVAVALNCTEEEASEKVQKLMTEKGIPSLRDAAEMLLLSLE